jgi:hypothetical protein
MKQTKHTIANRRRTKINELDNPFDPCRSTCTTIHNPKLMQEKLGVNTIERLH